MHKKQGFALPRRGPAGKRWAEFREIVPMAAVQAEKTVDSAENSALGDRPRRRAGPPRHQIKDGTGRETIPIARALPMRLDHVKSNPSANAEE
jgi:hypothetical protein